MLATLILPVPLLFLLLLKQVLLKRLRFPILIMADWKREKES